MYDLDIIKNLDLVQNSNMGNMDFYAASKLLMPIIPHFESIDYNNSDVSELYKMKRAAQVILHRTIDFHDNHLLTENELKNIFGHYMRLCIQLIEKNRQDYLECCEILFVSKIRTAFSQNMDNIEYTRELSKNALAAYPQMSSIINLIYKKIYSNMIVLVNEENSKIIMTEIKKKKLAFFVKHNLDTFLYDIIYELSSKYEITKIIIAANEDLKIIDKWIQWADACWFEWCDELVIYASRLEIAKERKIICRLHRYEVFKDYPKMINWNNVNKLIIVSSHLKQLLKIQLADIEDKVDIVTINNGVDIKKFIYQEKEQGFNIAHIGYIHYRKNPVLLLQIIKKLTNMDNRYKLFIAGKFQDNLLQLYWDNQVEKMDLKNNVFFEGWQDNIAEWLTDKNYILSTSIHESFGYGLAEAMAMGIKPIIHNFLYAEEVWDKNFLFNTIDEAIIMITESSYNSIEYRNYIKNNYSLEKQMDLINSLIDGVIWGNVQSFDYKNYWNKRLNAKFNIEGVGYIGLGELYNQFLYRNRIEILDGVIKIIFCDVNDKSILELGPGIGIFTKFFRTKSVKEYSAIDITEKSVTELSSEYKDYCFKLGDISNRKHYDKKYDMIFAAYVLLHITDEDNYKKTLKNISDYLKDDGYCIIMDSISIINTKSESPHVIIRDIEYIKNLLEAEGLELIQTLPVLNFMNYPFDRDVLGSKGQFSLDAFNLICTIFQNNSIDDEQKILLGEYLLCLEKQLLCLNRLGLSEKLLIIRKKGQPNNVSINYKDILDINTITDNITVLNKQLNDSFFDCNQIRKINSLISYLYESCPDPDYIRNRINQFVSYKTYDFDNYNFSTAKIIIGRREKIANGYEVMEFILNDSMDIMLIINNIWYDVFNNCFILPEQMNNSINSHYIMELLKQVLNYNLKFSNRIAGFVLNKNLLAEIKENYLAYIWERGIPASQFMPLLPFLKIVERYIFAGSFIQNNHKVLEAPCGYGYGAAYFSQICSQVEALDIQSDNILFSQKAYKNKNINWNIGDVTRLPYNDNEFDIYVSYEVLEHLPLEKSVMLIEEAYRVLRRSGTFIISTPNKEMRKHINNPFHIKEYGFNEFAEIINKYFKDVRFYSVSNFKVEEGMEETANNMIAVCVK